MPPTPLESALVAFQDPAAQANRQGSISLGILVDFIIQRTYHDITVLAEL